MIIEDPSFDPLTDPEPAGAFVDATVPLTDDEILAGRPSAEHGLFVATCAELSFDAQPIEEHIFGARIAGQTLRAGLAASGKIRRWYGVAREHELPTIDRAPELVVREHMVPMPLAWQIPPDEAALIARAGLIHAFVSTGLENPRQLLFRHCAALAVPCVFFTHSIPDTSAELLHFFAGQTFPFDLVIAPSESGRRALEAHFERLRLSVGAAPFAGQIAVVPHGVDNDEPWPEREASRQRLGYAPNELVIASIGRFERDYKADLAPLLVAFARLLERVPEARLVLGGAGDDYPPVLDALAEELGVSDRVELRPNMRHATKRALLAGADVFVAVADNVQETHGLAILEAMSAGRPVVATAWDGFAETVVDGATGVLVPTAWRAPAPEVYVAQALWLGTGRPSPLQAQHASFDIDAMTRALAELAGDRERRAKLGAAGRARVAAEFDGQKNAARAAELIVEACARARQSTLQWRPALGPDWLGVYGHYAGARTAARLVRAEETPLGPRRFARVDDANRARVRRIVERLLELADGRPEDAVITALCAEFPTFSRAGIARIVARAEKHGLVRDRP